MPRLWHRVNRLVEKAKTDSTYVVQAAKEEEQRRMEKQDEANAVVSLVYV